MKLTISDVDDIQISEILYDGFVVRSIKIIDKSNVSFEVRCFADDRNSLDFKYQPMRDERENTSC